MYSGPVHFTVGVLSLALLLAFAACEPGTDSIYPEGLDTLKVIVRDNRAYPIYQFTCADEEGPGENEDCPDGFACDGRHYHGEAWAIGEVAPNGAADVQFNPFFANDPDSCHCGWGKEGEADIRELSVFGGDTDDFLDEFYTGISSPPSVPGLTVVQAMNVDPCGG